MISYVPLLSQVFYHDLTHYNAIMSEQSFNTVTYSFIVLSWSLSTEVHNYNLAFGTDMDNLEKAREGMSHLTQNSISSVPVSIPEF